MTRECPRDAIADAMATFRMLPSPERHARVSHWTMVYLAALILPTIERGVRTGAVPPTAIDALHCERDTFGAVTRFVPANGILAAPADPADRFAELVDAHLAVLVAECERLAGFPTRVAWSNAGVMITHGLRMARAAPIADARVLRDAERLLDGTLSALAHPVREGRRRVCCLRDRLPGGASCAGLCPRQPQRCRSAGPDDKARRHDHMQG